MTSPKPIIVFLGPSLSWADAKKILPDACYLPPVRCGDVLRGLRLKPALIAIIDGYFEHTAAVWHKEILYAIEQGVDVMGSSSMGALRAAELAHYGMIGVGDIFTDYHQQNLIDDDEVAIIHQPAHYNYVPLSDAMVNIRATINAAVQQAIIATTDASYIINYAKRLCYAERSLAKAIDAAPISQQAREKIRTWLAAGYYVDQKKCDALALLQTIADGSIKRPLSHAAIATPKSAFFRALQRNVMCRPFSSYQPWLPMQEKVALIARYLGKEYKLLRRLGYLMATVYACVHKHHVTPSKQIIDTAFNTSVLQINGDAADWQQAHHCSQQEQAEFIYRISSMRALFALRLTHSPPGTTPQDYFLQFLKLYGYYQEYKSIALADKNPSKYALLYSLATLWWILETEIISQCILPDKSYLQDYSDKFRYQRQLLTQQATEQWLQNNDLNLTDYNQLMATAANFSFLVLQNNLDVLNIPPVQTNNWWLRDALWLTGYYQTAKELLSDKVLLESLKQQQLQDIKEPDQYAWSLDFVGGKLDFVNEIS